MRTFAVLSIVLGGCTPGCSQSPWDRYPMSTMPDKQCYIGGAVQGHDVYIWECVDGERVVIEKYSAEMSADTPHKYTVPCGHETVFEHDHVLDCAGHRSRPAWQPSN
jgi:hypothetical protein